MLQAGIQISEFIKHNKLWLLWDFVEELAALFQFQLI